MAHPYDELQGHDPAAEDELDQADNKGAKTSKSDSETVKVDKAK